MSGAPLEVALVHHPVRDRRGRLVTTAVTNLDVHDLARSCRAYGVRRFHVVTPVTSQRRIVEAIVEHWLHGEGARRVPERTEALRLCHAAASVREVSDVVASEHGVPPRLVATSARDEGGGERVSFQRLRASLAAEDVPYLLLFGTGHGLHPDLLDRCALRLQPIVPPGGYRHLSVRAAVAIALDRLLGPSRLE